MSSDLSSDLTSDLSVIVSIPATQDPRSKISRKLFILSFLRHEFRLEFRLDFRLECHSAGSVLLRDNQAVVVLSVAQDGAAAPGGPGGGPADNLQMLLNQVLAGDHAAHESRQPLARKHLAAMVCNIQKGLRAAGVLTPHESSYMPWLSPK